MKPELIRRYQENPVFQCIEQNRFDIGEGWKLNTGNRHNSKSPRLELNKSGDLS